MTRADRAGSQQRSAISPALVHPHLFFAFETPIVTLWSPCAPKHVMWLRVFRGASEFKVRNLIWWTGHSAIYVGWLFGWRYITLLHSADEPQEGRNSRPLLRFCFISSCHVGVSKRFSLSVSLAVYRLSLNKRVSLLNILLFHWHNKVIYQAAISACDLPAPSFNNRLTILSLPYIAAVWSAVCPSKSDTFTWPVHLINRFRVLASPVLAALVISWANLHSLKVPPRAFKCSATPWWAFMMASVEMHQNEQSRKMRRPSLTSLLIFSPIGIRYCAKTKSCWIWVNSNQFKSFICMA